MHRRDQFRADKMVVDHALNNPKIVPVMDSVLESIEGSDIVEKIVVRNVKTNEKREIPLSGVFIFIGTLPNDEYVHDLLQRMKAAGSSPTPACRPPCPAFSPPETCATPRSVRW